MGREVITAIEEINYHRMENKRGYDTRFDGYKITTTEQEIYILISSDSQCCENYGYIVSEDEIERFVGAEIKRIYEVSEENKYNPKIVNLLTDDSVSIDSTVFINVKTTKGMLQFAVYNDHNGYYGHDIKIMSNQFNYEATI